MATVVYDTRGALVSAAAPPPTKSGCTNILRSALDINDVGQIVGYVGCNDGLSNLGGRGFVFNGSSYEYIDPPTGREGCS